jgi:hypothetical protein
MRSCRTLDPGAKVTVTRDIHGFNRARRNACQTIAVRSASGVALVHGEEVAFSEIAFA